MERRDAETSRRVVLAVLATARPVGLRRVGRERRVAVALAALEYLAPVVMRNGNGGDGAFFQMALCL